MPRAMLIGNLAVDRVAGAPPRPGGAVWYCAHALHTLNPHADVVLVCRSTEEDGGIIVPQLERLGFPVIWRAAERTTRFSFHYEGDRRIMRLDELGDPWTTDDIAGWVRNAMGEAEWILVGALTREDFSRATLSALAAHGSRLAIDAQGLVRYGAPGPLEADGNIDRALLEHITVLKLNDEEAEQLCGGTDETSLRALGVPEVVLTLGSQGAVILSGEESTRVAAVPVNGPVDPTGAGDSFLMAYAVARLAGDDAHTAGLAASRFVSTIIAR